LHITKLLLMPLHVLLLLLLLLLLLSFVCCRRLRLSRPGLRLAAPPLLRGPLGRAR
jgi:hypothetical protein